MKITRQTIKELHKLTDAVVKAEEYASELLRIAQDRFNNVKEKLQREGKEITVTRKVLWDEVFYLGGDCEAAIILKKYHPEVFKAYEVQEKAAKALQVFVSKEMEVDMKKMRISDYVKLTEGIVSMMLDERDGKGGGAVRSPFRFLGGKN